MSEICNINNKQKEEHEIISSNLNKNKQALINPDNKVILSFGCCEYYLFFFFLLFMFSGLCVFIVNLFIYTNDVISKIITAFVCLLVLIIDITFALKITTKIELIKNESYNLLTIKIYSLFCHVKFCESIHLENVLIDYLGVIL